MLKKKEPVVEDSFIREINEELKNENIRKLWDKYGLHLIVALVVILTLTVSFETLKNWRIKRFEDASNTYAYALALQGMDRTDESINVLQKLQQGSSGIYADIAQMQIANILLEQGKNTEASALLESIVQDKKITPQIRDIAAVKLASYKLDSAPAEEISALLQPLQQEGNSWKNVAKEILAMLEIREKNMEEARRLYSEIAGDPQASENIRSRAQDMLSVLDNAV